MSRPDTLATLEQWRRTARELSADAHAEATGDLSGRDPERDASAWESMRHHRVEETTLMRVIELLRAEPTAGPSGRSAYYAFQAAIVAPGTLAVTAWDELPPQTRAAWDAVAAVRS